MIMVPRDQLRVHGHFANGQVVTKVSEHFVATTAQRQVDESEAATFAYLDVGDSTTKPGYAKLIKHPNIRGRRAKKALGA